MALRDWHGWQIGVLWAVGIAISWLVGRLGVAAVGATPVADSAQIAAGVAPPISAGGAPLWTTAVTLLILALLLFITARWIRGQIFDA